MDRLLRDIAVRIRKLTPPKPRTREAVSGVTTVRLPFIRLKVAINPSMCQL